LTLHGGGTWDAGAFDPDIAMPSRLSKLRLLTLAFLVISGTARAKREEPARLDLPANATATQLAEQRGQADHARTLTQPQS